uniref:PGG domain-containing protein n=1 Tax=Davidia involucrata TaxID=16924 RepID=A0A5B6ZQU5_DAVIN
MASSSSPEHEYLTSKRRNYSGRGEENNFPLPELKAQQQSEADVESKLESPVGEPSHPHDEAEHFFDETRLTTNISSIALSSECSDLEMNLQRNQTLVGKLTLPAGKGEVSSWMKPEVYRAITKGDKDSFTSEDDKHSVLEQVSSRKKNTVLHVAASLGHYKLVEEILNRYPQLVKCKNSNDDLALHLAASAGHQSIVECILHHAKQHAGGQASGSGQLKIVIEEDNITASGNNGQLDILIEKNEEENTALHVAMKNQHYKLAKFLVEKNQEASVSLNQEKMSPLYMAAEAGRLELVNLMTANRRAKITDLKGKSLVHAAIKGRKRDVLDAVMRYQSTNLPTLVEGWCSLSIPFDEEFDEKGRTPLSFAASIGFLDGVRYFLNKTFKAAYTRDQNGFFPIHWASIRGHVNIIKVFLQRCPDSLELLNKQDQNILHVAAEIGKANVVLYILQMPEFEMLLNEKDVDGNTPLHLATEGGHPRVVSILAWNKRVKLELTNNKGLTAMDVALNYPQPTPSFKQRLTWMALGYASAPRAPQLSKSTIGEKTQSTGTKGENTQSTDTKGENTQSTDTNNSSKDRVETLLLVATLVATVTFAAGFTIPGGYNSSDPKQGMATLVQKHLFPVFLISNTIAMYSSIVVVVILIWAQLGDLSLVVASLKLAVPLLGISLTMVSLTFMAGVHMVVSNLNWLANFILITGSISLLALLVVFVPLFLPSSLNNHILQHILRYPLYLLILVIEWVTERKAHDDTEE